MNVSMAGWGRTGRGHYLSVRTDDDGSLTVAVIRKDRFSWKLAVKKFADSTSADAWLDAYQASEYGRLPDWAPPQYVMIFDRLTDARDIGFEKLSA